MSLRLARVVHTHPEDNSVDIAMLDDNSRHVAVQVLAIGASTNTGLVDLPEPAKTSNEWGQSERTDRDIIAVVSMLAGTPVPIVVGFLFPQVNGVLFADKNLKITRHASDVYSTINDTGDIELSHPSGTFVRIAENPAHVNLTGTDFDKRWKIEKNTASAPFLAVVVKNAGVLKARLEIDPDGNITVEHEGNLVVNTAGNANITVDGDTVLVSADVTVDSPTTTITGDVLIQGSLSVTGAGVTHNGTNIGDDHAHSGVSTGVSNTGAPI